MVVMAVVVVGWLCVMTVMEMHGGRPSSLQVFVTSSYNKTWKR